MPDFNDVIAEFHNTFAAAGLVPPAEIIADGQWHRCDVAGKRPRNNDGRYRLYTDRWPAGVLQNFIEGRLDIWHPNDRGRKASHEERAERQRYYDERRAEAAAEIADGQERVAAEAEHAWKVWLEECTADKPNPYLALKLVGAHDVRTNFFGNTLYVPLRDVDGKLWNRQEIWSNGTKRYQPGGRVAGLFHMIGELVDGEPIQIGEGYATVASCYEANGITSIVAFDSGNLIHSAKAIHERYPNSPITILADDDTGTARRLGIENPGIKVATAAALAVGGKIAVPQFGPDRDDEQQTDFNDLHVSGGLDVVAQQIAAAKEPERPGPTYPRPDHQLELDDARTGIERVVVEFKKDADKFAEDLRAPPRPGVDVNGPPKPPVTCIRITPGAGKTTGAFRHLVAPLVKEGKRVYVLIGEHDTGEERVAELAAMGIQSRVIRARGAPDPLSPGLFMCIEKDRSAAIASALGEVDGDACKNRGKKKGVCDHYETCGFQRQKRDLPSVLFLAHQYGFYNLPSGIPQPDVVVIDEKFHTAAEADDIELDLRLLVNDRGDHSALTDGESVDLLQTAMRARDALAKLTAPCRLRCDMFPNITVEDAEQAYILEWKRKKELHDVYPGLEESAAINRAKLREEHNNCVRKLAEFWKFLKVTLSSDLEESINLEFAINDTGPCVVISQCHKLTEWTTKCPVLHLDGTMRREIVTLFFPDAKFHEIDVKHPPCNVVYTVQVTDRLMSNDSVIPRDDESDNKNKSREARLRDIRGMIDVAKKEHGKAVVICQKALEDELRKGRGLPSGVSVAHYGAVRGKNTFADTPAIALIGRTEPNPRSIEKLARLLSGREVMRADGKRGYYRETTRYLTLRGREHGVAVLAHYHPEPLCEALRWSANEAEGYQAAHRARIIARTRKTPLQIYIAASVALPLEVDRALPWREARPSLLQNMLLERAIATNSPTDAFKLFPGWFPNVNAAKKQFRYAEAKGPLSYNRVLRILPDTRRADSLLGVVSSSYRDSALLQSEAGDPDVAPAGYRVAMLGFWPYWHSVRMFRYRRVGERWRTATGWYDPAVILDPIAWLTRELEHEVVPVDAA